MRKEINKLSSTQLRNVATQLNTAGKLDSAEADLQKINTAHHDVLRLVQKSAPQLEGQIRELLGMVDLKAGDLACW